MVETIGRTNFLLVADCKLSSLSHRAQIHRQGGFYLCPLSMAGNRDEILRSRMGGIIRQPKSRTLRLKAKSGAQALR